VNIPCKATAVRSQRSDHRPSCACYGSHWRPLISGCRIARLALTTIASPSAATKLQPPTVRRPVVARERLLGLRPDPLEASVVTIIAPAGYGKSTLLQSWVEAADLPVVWLSLDRHDNDPVTLATSIALAILEAWPSARAIEEALEAPMASIWSLLMPRLSAELTTRSPYIQVIDDIHEISEPEAWMRSTRWRYRCPPTRSWSSPVARRRGWPGPGSTWNDASWRSVSTRSGSQMTRRGSSCAPLASRACDG